MQVYLTGGTHDIASLMPVLLCAAVPYTSVMPAESTEISVTEARRLFHHGSVLEVSIGCLHWLASSVPVSEMHGVWDCGVMRLWYLHGMCSRAALHSQSSIREDGGKQA